MNSNTNKVNQTGKSTLKNAKLLFETQVLTPLTLWLPTVLINLKTLCRRMGDEICLDKGSNGTGMKIEN